MGSHSQSIGQLPQLATEATAVTSDTLGLNTKNQYSCDRVLLFDGNLYNCYSCCLLLQRQLKREEWRLSPGVCFWSSSPLHSVPSLEGQDNLPIHMHIKTFLPPLAHLQFY